MKRLKVGGRRCGVRRYVGIFECGQLRDLPEFQWRTGAAAGLAALSGSGHQCGLCVVYWPVCAAAASERGDGCARSHLAVNHQCHVVHGYAGAHGDDGH